jgi:hypothetical protein
MSLDLLVKQAKAEFKEECEAAKLKYWRRSSLLANSENRLEIVLGACPSSRWLFGGESDSDFLHEQAF